jgi:enoyl-[acyl-carrier protein] reductase III
MTKGRKPMSRLLQDQIVIFAGASGRVGGATLAAIVAHGASAVVVPSRTLARAQRSIDEHLAPGDRAAAIPFEADLSADGSGATLASFVARRFSRIDSVVSLAGGGSAFVSILESTHADLEESVRNNLFVAYHLFVPALRLMLGQEPRAGARSRGRLVAVTAGSSLTPQPRFGIMGAGKAGVNLLMRAIAREHKDAGIISNAVVLGGVAIEAARRYLSEAEFAAAATPAEVADVLVFHASDASSGVNGELIHLNARETD